MNIKIGESRISISVEGCFRCGTSFSSGWYPFKEIALRLDEKSVKWITLHICNDCATPVEKTAARQNDSASGVQKRLEI
jgi:predicted P-loop ATPase